MLTQNYFELLQLPVGFDVDRQRLALNYRQLQAQYHPDKFAHASDQEQRHALQLSAHINEAYDTLRQPTKRASYLLQLAEGRVRGDHTMRPDPAFLMQQLEWREALAEVDDSVDPIAALDDLMLDVKAALGPIESAFHAAFEQGDYGSAHHQVDKMQFVYKLLAEAEAVEARLLDE